MKIESLQNPQIKRVRALRERKERNRSNVFLIEGYTAISRALDSGLVKWETLFVSVENFLGKNETVLIERIQDTGCRVLFCSRRVFEKISYRDRPDGLLAIGEQFDLSIERLAKKGGRRLVLVVEGVEKPGNLGAILRSADAAGASVVILCDVKTDVWNPNVVRASKGALFTVPLVLMSSEAALAWLEKESILPLVTTPDPKVDNFFEANLMGDVALVVGSEQYGLSSRWLSPAMRAIQIPMLGQMDSLNVATAATLVLYEAVRQGWKKEKVSQNSD